MNPMSLAKRYLAGVGDNQYAQEALDYGIGALGIGGLTALGNLGDGADQNVLLQGVLGAPVATYALRNARAQGAKMYVNKKLGLDPSSDTYLSDMASSALNMANTNPAAYDGLMNITDAGLSNIRYAERQLQNPYTQAALAASGGALVGGLSGRVFDNDATGTSLGLALLGGVAPITYSMIRSRGNTMTSEPIGTSRSPVNPKTGYYGSVGKSQPFDIGNAPGYSGETVREDRLLDRLFNRSK